MLVPENRQQLGLVPTLSVASNITLASLAKFTKSFFLSKQLESSDVTKMISALVIKTSTPQQLIGSLSGGNQQKVVVAKALLTEPKFYCWMNRRAGLIIASQLLAAPPATGESFELNAIAAVVLGGTSLSGGRGPVGGTLIGAFVISVLSAGLVLLGVSEFW